LVDISIAQWFRDPSRLPGDVQKMVNMGEMFGFGGGAAMICLAAWVLDRSRRTQMPRLWACVIGSGLAANLAKGLIMRTRPYGFDFQGGVFQTFGPWLPAFRELVEEARGASVQAFPSGHTATAVALAVGLSRMYPQGRKLFAAFAIMAAFQRIAAGAHYLSDTFAGAGIALLVSGVCFDSHLLGRSFSRLERRRSGKDKQLATGDFPRPSAVVN
jgi:membrane-associated phospholipid phosphatase